MPVFSPSSLLETSTAIFAAAGMRPELARIVAELLVEPISSATTRTASSASPSTWAKSKPAT